VTKPLAPRGSMLKKCSKCLIDLPLDNFGHRANSADGRRGRCKKCNCQENEKWKKKNPVSQLCSNMLVKAKRRAQSKGLAFDLTFKDLQHLAVSHCPVLGTELMWEYGHGLGIGAHSPSLDRINNSLGYTKNNVAIISHKANAMKNSCTVEEIQAILNYMQNASREKTDPHCPQKPSKLTSARGSLKASSAQSLSVTHSTTNQQGNQP